MRIIFDVDSPHVDKNFHWGVILSDGRTIYEDKIQGEASTWLRLHKYLLINVDIKIISLFLRYKGTFATIERDNDDDGFFFSKSSRGLMGGSEFLYKGIGYFRGGKAYVRWYGEGPDNNIAEEIECGQEDIRIIRHKHNAQVSVCHDS